MNWERESGKSVVSAWLDNDDIHDVQKLNQIKDKKRETNLYVQEHLNFYINNIHTNGIKKKDYTNVSKQVEIYSCCSMNKQYVQGIKTGKKAYLMRKNKIVMQL